METLLATEKLAKMGFVVLPYIQADPVLCKRLEEVGSAAVMPLAAPIGSNKGLVTRDLLKSSSSRAACRGGRRRTRRTLPRRRGDGNRRRCRAGEYSYRRSRRPVRMARAFADATVAGREAFEAGLGAVGSYGEATSPLTSFLD